MNIKDYKGVWVFAEQRDGKLLDAGIEILGAGRKLADKAGRELAAVVLGHNVGALADQLAAYGADRVYVADSPLLKHYTNDAYSLVLASMIDRYKPEILLIGGTSLGMDLAPRVAAKVNTGLSAHAVDLDMDKDGCLLASVPAFGGSIMASISCARHRPQMATVPPGFLKKPEKNPARKAQVEKVTVQLRPDQVRTKVVEVFREESKARPLGDAEIVVAGGFGIGNKENWKKLEELAGVLGASVGATRPACDEGWADLENQMIGQSGKTIHPKLYIGVGISGALHHLIGIKDSKVIVAINDDAKAPIVSASDYVMLGDHRELVPALIAELKKGANT